MTYTLRELEIADWFSKDTYKRFHGLRNGQSYDYLVISFDFKKLKYNLHVYLSELSLNQGFHYLLESDFPPRLISYAAKQGVRFNKPKFRVKAHGQKA